DQLHQRYRLALDARLQRAFARMEQLTEVEGAFLSGSGSTLMALAKAGEEEAARQSCLRVLQEEGLTADAHLLSADNQGLIIERLGRRAGHRSTSGSDPRLGTGQRAALTRAWAPVNERH